jgi:NAD(P)-dependent dehydrogenase (short-subunit alcohol dehydrogenase family)
MTATASAAGADPAIRPSGDASTTGGPGADWLGLGGRVCAVTGAAGGIGQDIARELARAGASVALLDRDRAACAAVAADIERSGGRALALECDVADAASVNAAAAACRDAIGTCRVLVNNAAALYADPLLDIELDKWNRLLSINLTGYLLCAQAFGRQMVAAGGGSMVHVSSISGTFPQPYSGAYSVSKAGINMLSKLLAVELGEHGVRSNVVAPAIVRTPLSEAFYRDPEILRRRTEIVPTRRIGAPRDIADTVLFLASERSIYISGQDITVDGGVSQALLSLIPRPGFDRKDQKAR